MPRKSWLHAVSLRKVMVHLDTDTSIEGMIGETGADGLLLRFAKLHAPNQLPVDLAGETWVPRERIVMVQAI